MICNKCGDEFKNKMIKKGKINECDDCSKESEDVPPYLGFNDGQLNKMSNIAIYKGNDPITRKKISNQNNRVH
jgi:hypothetical protein